MQIKINNTIHIAEIWLTNAEQDDSNIEAMLKPMYKNFNQQGIMPVVYLSGKGDLIADTKALIRSNYQNTAEHMIEAGA